MGVIRALPVAALAILAAASDQKPYIGGISSQAPVEIDGTSMAPAAPSWPLVDRDEVRTTTAPGLILTRDQNAITLMPATSVRLRNIAPNQTWIFVREGGLSLDTKKPNVLICIGNRVFQPSAAAQGSLKVDPSGAVSSSVTQGAITEVRVKSCSETLPTGMTGASGAVAGGTASGVGGITTTAVATAAAAAAGAGIAATTAALGFSSANTASTSSCLASNGCNFNPPPVSPSGP